MKIETLLRVQTAGDSPPPRAPRVILYVPPSGKAIHGNDVETASRTAELYASEHPGRTIAIYELVGYAYKPITPTEFTSADSEKAAKELLPPEPDDGSLSDGPEPEEEVDRSGLMPEQQETLRAMREAMREKPNLS